MKKALIALTLALAGNSLAQTAVAVSHVTQTQTNWCWAASSESLLAAYGITASQSSIATYKVGGANLPATMSDVSDVIDHFSSGTVLGDSIQSALSFADTVTQLTTSKRPFVIGLLGSTGHAIIAKTVNSTTTNITIMDPQLGDNFYTYNDLTTNYAGTGLSWQQTLTVFHTATTPTNLNVYEATDPSGCYSNIIWDGYTYSVASAYSYKIERQVNGGSWTLAKTSTGTFSGFPPAGAVAGLGDTDSVACSPGNTIRYRMSQVNTTGSFGYQSGVIYSAVMTVPMTPTLAAENAGEYVHFTWNALGASTSLIQYRAAGTTSWSNFPILSATPSDYATTAIPEFQPYEYRLQNFYAPDTNTSVASIPSTPVTISRFAAWFVPVFF